MPLPFSAQTWRDLIAVEIDENKIQWNDCVIRIAGMGVVGHVRGSRTGDR